MIELLLVRTLLRSVPLACSMLDREVMAELTLDRSTSSPFASGDAWGGRGNASPCVTKGSLEEEEEGLS